MCVRSLCAARSESKAIELLSQRGWRLDAAADLFFMSGGGSMANVDDAKIGELFESYKGVQRAARPCV